MGGVVIGLLLTVAYLTYFERKIIASMQLRKGPNTVGFFGLLQPIADAIKLLRKEHITPKNADRFLFLAAPFVTLVLSLSVWAVIPIDSGKVFADLNMGILYLMVVMALSVYGIFIAGWSSGSKYAFLGTIRAISQFISYEIVLGFVLLTVVMWSGTFNLSAIVKEQEHLWFIVPLFPFFVVFLIAGLAESNRLPFDLPEAESELVAGYHVEYSSMGFGFFFLGEYLHLLFLSAFTTLLFLGGWNAVFANMIILPGYVWFALKMSILLFLTIWIRATLPRLRYDQLMSLCWKALLPFLLVALVIFSIIKLLTNNL
ncbi:MAG: NADH-quinone oxidoreductase subunit NuoH [Alphaproteobacteria bacterium]